MLTYRRRSHPVAYVVPLRDDCSVAASFVVALTSYLPDKKVVEELPLYATGHGAPWRPEEVLRVPFTRRKALLPVNLYLRGLVERHDWTHPDLRRLSSEFVEHSLDSGYVGWRWAAGVAFHEGERPRDGLPVGEGAFWRQGRATILVDLDLAAKCFERGVARAANSDFVLASDGLAGAASILAGTAFEFVGGRRLRAEESTDRYLATRRDARALIRRRYLANPFWPPIRKAVLRELQRRGGRESPAARLGDATDAALIATLPEVVLRKIAKFFDLADPPLTQVGVLNRLEELRRRLIGGVEYALNVAVTDDLLRPGWLADRRRLRRKWPATRAIAPPPVGSEPDTDTLPDESRPDPLDRLIEQQDRLMAQVREAALIQFRAGLSGRELDFCDSVLLGPLTPTQWARDRGLDKNTGHVVKARIMNKLRRFVTHYFE